MANLPDNFPQNTFERAPPLLTDPSWPRFHAVTEDDLREIQSRFPGPQLTKRTLFETSNYVLAEAEVGLEIYRKRRDGSWVCGVELSDTDAGWKAVQRCKEWMIRHNDSVLHNLEDA